MRTGMRTFTLLVVFCVDLCGFGQTVLSSTPVASVPGPREGASPVWSRSLPQSPVQVPSISAAALAPNGDCAAVAGSGIVEVLDIKGRQLWSWEYGKQNRFIKAGGLALSPNCDAIALVGDSGYKYTWIADRHGHRVPIQTSSTPLGIAFSHDGKVIALGTGGCDLLLLGESGEVKWKKTYNEGYCTWGELAFPPGDKFIMLDAGLITLDGTLVWNRPAWGIAAARDSETFVTWSAPNHGPQVGTVSVFDAAGKELWSRVAPGESAAISAAGDRIAAPVYEEHDFSPEDWDKYQDQPVEIRLFSRSGESLKTLPLEAREVLGMSPDGDRVLVRMGDFIEEVDLDGNALLKIADPPMGYSKVVVPDDFSGVLVWRRTVPATVEWFLLK